METCLSAPESSPALQTGQVRVAAIGDLHMRAQTQGHIQSQLERLSHHAELLLIAGDLTENGRLAEAEATAELLSLAHMPIVAVLGNHDLRALRKTAFRRTLERRGIEVLEGQATTIVLESGERIGVAGTTGCGGGFWPLEGPDALHTRTMKRLALRARRESAVLDQALASLGTDVSIALTHFAPTTTTLGCEPIAKYWMLGNSELGVVLDRRSPDLVIHGHAHLGAPRGATPGGVPVRNVALPVIGGVHVETLKLPGAHAEPMMAFKQIINR